MQGQWHPSDLEPPVDTRVAGRPLLSAGGYRKLRRYSSRPTGRTIAAPDVRDASGYLARRYAGVGNHWGNVLIGIAAKPATPIAAACGICQLAVPEEVPCPKCQHPVRLHPSATLGCVASKCAGRMWSYLCCPECDCLWAFHGKSQEKSEDKAAEEKQSPENAAGTRHRRSARCRSTCTRKWTSS